MPSLLLLLLLLLLHQRAYHLAPVCVCLHERATRRHACMQITRVAFYFCMLPHCAVGGWLRPLLLLLLQNNLYANYSHIDIQLSTHTHYHNKRSQSARAKRRERTLRSFARARTRARVCVCIPRTAAQGNTFQRYSIAAVYTQCTLIQTNIHGHSTCLYVFVFVRKADAIVCVRSPGQASVRDNVHDAMLETKWRKQTQLLPVFLIVPAHSMYKRCLQCCVFLSGDSVLYYLAHTKIRVSQNRCHIVASEIRISCCIVFAQHSGVVLMVGGADSIQTRFIMICVMRAHTSVRLGHAPHANARACTGVGRFCACADINKLAKE